MGVALQKYASDELRRAGDCLGWRGSRLHLGVHQARKSLRRVRATLALAATALGRGGRVVDRELRRLTRSLSELRDAQALVEAIERLSKQAQAPEQTALLRRARAAAIRRRALAGRTAARRREFQNERALISMLLAALDALPWTTLRATDVLAAHAKSTSRGQAAARRACTTGSDEAWHRWRRRARRLTQQHRALDGLVDIAASERERSKALAVLLGEVQDGALLANHCGKRSPFPAELRQPLQRFAREALARQRRYAATAEATTAPGPG